MENAFALNFTLGSILVPIFGIIAYKLKILDVLGVIASLIVGITIFWFGGWTWFLQIFYFLTAASIFTRFKYSLKYNQGLALEGGEIRTWTNVAANGGAASIATVIYGFTGHALWYAFFVGSVSSVAADTLATEVGLTSKTPPRLITNLNKIVAPGTSGGITLVGEVAALLAAAFSGVIGFFGASLLGSPYFKVLLIALTSGFLGANVDSLLGASVQGIYTCGVCGKTTEKKIHCEKKTTLQRGSTRVDNDFVNLSSSIIGGLAAVALYYGV
ncbi:MAG: TIGR00297 family protein [Candidatus Geothermarchaeales archaeon]